MNPPCRPDELNEGLVMSGQKDSLGASADADRATDAPHGAPTGLRPDGSVSTGARFTPGPWEADGTIPRLDAVRALSRPMPNDLPVIRDSLRFWVAVPFDGGRQAEEAEANARLIAAAPDFASACGADLHPGEADSCGPLAWLRSAIDTLKEDAVRNAASGDDPDAYWEMVAEVEQLHAKLSAALSKVQP